jgi:hypothetical protein
MPLTKNWITEHLIDFEYKKYQLLAYLQEVKENYASTRVYPWLSEVIDHYKNLLSVKKNSEEIKPGGKGELKGFNWKDLTLDYEVTEEDDELIREIKQIIDYSLPLFFSNIKEGKLIYDFVEEKLSLKAIGITPLKTDEGYLLLHCENQPEVFIYQYQLSFFSHENERMRSLSTSFLDARETNFSYTYEKMKHDLITQHKELPNPAVYAIDCAVAVPLNETLLPIAKRYFVGKMMV